MKVSKHYSKESSFLFGPPKFCLDSLVFQIKFLAYSFFFKKYIVTHAIHIADIQAPRTSKGVLRSGRSFSKDSLMGHWQSIIESLNTILCTMKENFVRN
jgi:hypothetical protein